MPYRRRHKITPPLDRFFQSSGTPQREDCQPGKGRHWRKRRREMSETVAFSVAIILVAEYPSFENRSRGGGCYLVSSAEPRPAVMRRLLLAPKTLLHVSEVTATTTPAYTLVARLYYCCMTARRRHEHATQPCSQYVLFYILHPDQPADLVPVPGAAFSGCWIRSHVRDFLLFLRPRRAFSAKVSRSSRVVSPNACHK